MSLLDQRHGSRRVLWGTFILLLPTTTVLAGNAYAETDDDPPVPEIVVIGERMEERDALAIRNYLQAERERLHQEALMAELERKRQMEFEDEENDKEDEEELTDAEKALLCQIASDRLSDANARIVAGFAVMGAGGATFVGTGTTGVGALAGFTIFLSGAGVTVSGAKLYYVS